MKKMNSVEDAERLLLGEKIHETVRLANTD
jgi:hypothetical protein